LVATDFFLNCWCLETPSDNIFRHEPSSIQYHTQGLRLLWLVRVILLTELKRFPKPKSKLLYGWQSVSMSWYRVPLWDLWPDIISCRNVAVWNLLSCIYGAPTLTRGRVCNLRCNHSMVRVSQNPKPYFTASSETPLTSRARFPYLYPPGTGWPSYTPGHWVPFTSSLTTLRATVACTSVDVLRRTQV
jgi:hypothetical protein